MITITPSFDKVGNAFKNMITPEKLETALAEFVFNVEGKSKKFSPVDTGRMRASIFTRVQGLTATIKPNVFYAGFVHWGTRKMRARPFMQWGVEAVPASPYFTASVKKMVDTEVSKI